MIRREHLVVAALVGCGHTTEPRSTPVSAHFMVGEAVEDCVEMARMIDRLGAWAPRYRNERGEVIALYPTDELWVLNLSRVPPSRTGSPAHGLRGLTVTCGGEQRAFQAIACRNGAGLHLYVDPAQQDGWPSRGTPDAGCRIDVDIDGVLYRDDRKILLRPGLRERLGPIDPSPHRYNEPHAPPTRAGRPIVEESMD